MTSFLVYPSPSPFILWLWKPCTQLDARLLRCAPRGPASLGRPRPGRNTAAGPRGWADQGTAPPGALLGAVASQLTTNHCADSP